MRIRRGRRDDRGEQILRDPTYSFEQARATVRAELRAELARGRPAPRRAA